MGLNLGPELPLSPDKIQNWNIYLCSFKAPPRLYHPREHYLPLIVRDSLGTNDSHIQLWLHTSPPSEAVSPLRADPTRYRAFSPLPPPATQLVAPSRHSKVWWVLIHSINICEFFLCANHCAH